MLVLLLSTSLYHILQSWKFQRITQKNSYEQNKHPTQENTPKNLLPRQYSKETSNVQEI